MYKFLDQPVHNLSRPVYFLLAAMRTWAQAAQERRCHCRQLKQAFSDVNAIEALADFNIAMATLNRDSTRTLCFGRLNHPIVTEDEAYILALFHATANHSTRQRDRITACLVTPDAVVRLQTAAESVASHFAELVTMEREQ